MDAEDSNIQKASLVGIINRPKYQDAFNSDVAQNQSFHLFTFPFNPFMAFSASLL